MKRFFLTLFISLSLFSCRVEESKPVYTASNIHRIPYGETGTLAAGNYTGKGVVTNAAGTTVIIEGVTTVDALSILGKVIIPRGTVLIANNLVNVGGGSNGYNVNGTGLNKWSEGITDRIFPDLSDASVAKEPDKKLEQKSGDYSLKLGKIILKLDLNKDRFKTKDSNIFLYDSTNKEIAKYQLKGNTTSRLSNLVFEPVEKAAGSARLGKAPLQLVAKLAAFYDKSIYNNVTKDNANYPKDKIQFLKRQKEYEKMYDRLSKNSLVKEIGVKSKTEFLNNFEKAFSGPEPWIANIKLMQMYFIDKVLQLSKDKRDEFLTDLLFVSQKKGDKVFDFGPFGKLY